MTIHNAKGLEFGAVFLIGMEEGIFPHVRSIEEQGIEEERRLAYVGMTRAKERLTLTHAATRSLFGTRAHNLPSRFLDELPQGEIVRERLRPFSWSSSGPATVIVEPRADSADARHGRLGAPRDARRGRRRRDRGGRHRRRPLRRRERRAAADARLRPARKDRVVSRTPWPSSTETRRRTSCARRCDAANVAFGNELRDDDFEIQQHGAAGGPHRRGVRRRPPGRPDCVDRLRDDDSRRRRAVRGHDVRRRDADAPPPGRPHRAHARSSSTTSASAGSRSRPSGPPSPSSTAASATGSPRRRLLMEAENAGFAFRDDPGPTGTRRGSSRRRRRESSSRRSSSARALQRDGMLSRSEARWDARVEDPEHWRDGASPKYYVLVELDGQGEAFAMYRVKEKWERGMPLSELVLVDAIATSTEATRELWRYLFGVDLVARVTLWNSDPATPLFLMVKDARRLQLRLARRHLAAARRRRRGAAAALVRRRRLASCSRSTDDVLSVERRAATAPARTRGRRRTRAGAAALGRRSRVRVPRRVLVRAPRGSGPRGGARRRRDRARDGALPHRAAAVLPRAVLAWPSRSVRARALRSSSEAVGAISEYGAWEIDDEVAERFLRCHPARAHACGLRGQARRRRRRGVSRSSSPFRAGRCRVPASRSSASIRRTGGAGSSRR